MIELRGHELRERVGRVDQVISATPVVLGDGNAAGVRAIIVRAAGIDATVVVDRALDVAACSYRGVPLVWHGPGGIQPPHPATLSDDAFERRFFGGLVTTCGLEAFGPAGHDEDGSWGQHGHVNHIAAEHVRCRVDEERGTVTIEGAIHQARMFGERLLLKRCWEIDFDRPELRLRDEVSNHGGARVPHMMLYHCNAGFPVLGESTRVSISQSGMRPRDAHSERGLEHWNEGGAPSAGFKEQVFIHAAMAIEGEWARAAIRSHGDAGFGFEVLFKPEQLPACFSWRMLGPGTYVMAVEPANCATIEGRIAARRDGTLPFLNPGETRTYDLRFRMFGDGSPV